MTKIKLQKMLDDDRFIPTVASCFCLGYGTLNAWYIGDFISGLFAGAAVAVTVEIWIETET